MHTETETKVKNINVHGISLRIRHESLTKQDEIALVKRAQNNDAKAIEILTESYTGYVIRLAKRLNGYNLDVADLISEGLIGLLKAIYRYDESHASQLGTFAHQYIISEMNEFIIKNYRMVKKATTKPLRHLFFKARSNIMKEKNAHPEMSHSELNAIVAKKMKVTPGELNEMLLYMNHSDFQWDSTELEKPIDADRIDSSAIFDKYKASTEFAPDVIHSAGRESERIELIKETLPLLLNDRECDIISQRWLTVDEDKASLQSLGDKHDISAERVRQIEKKALADLKKALH
jgi:RNA polymerase sigma-32 factor